MSDEIKTEVHEMYIEWLRAKVDEYCNPEGMYEVYWDRGDFLSPDDLACAAAKWKDEGYADPEMYLEDMLLERMGSYQEHYLYGQISDDLQKAPEGVEACWEASQSIWEDLEQAGYHGVEMNLDELLGMSTFEMNVMFATQAEQNRDMASIVDAFGNDYVEPDLSRVDGDDLDNALSYLVNQQGHSVSDVYGALAGADCGSLFVDSVAREIQENASEAMSELCALVRMDGQEALAFFEKVEAGQGSLILPRDATVGIFNQWSGCGGMLDIELEKDAVMPLALVREAQIEDVSASNRWGGYTVNEVYGLVGSAWGEFEVSDETSWAACEDYAAVLSDMRESIDGLQPPCAPDLDELEADARDGAEMQASEAEARNPCRDEKAV